jgi:hypothetical protein
MRPAYLRIRTGKIHRAGIREIVVETILRQVAIEEFLPQFNWRKVRLRRNRISVLQRNLLDILDGSSLNP